MKMKGEEIKSANLNKYEKPKFMQDKSEEELNKKIIKNGIDLSLALIIYNLEWWKKKILFYENEELRKNSFQNILSDSILKDDIPLICYSLSENRYELNKSISNPEIFFYDIFINPIKTQNKPIKTKKSKPIEKQSIKDFIAEHPFKFTLGYYVYSLFTIGILQSTKNC